MEQSKNGPSTRRLEHLANVRAALEGWRFKTKRDHYSLRSVTAEAILPNPILTTLASNAHIRTVEDIVTVINPPWIMARRHGEDVLKLLKTLDDAAREGHEREKRARAAERSAATAMRQAERQQVVEAEREARRQEKAAAKAALMMERERVRAEREAVKAQKRHEHEAAKANKPKRPRKAPLIGSSVFNGTPSSNLTHQVRKSLAISLHVC
jgi:bloom syndrome protein